jgi:tRNA(Ile)-lysidine synthase
MQLSRDEFSSLMDCLPDVAKRLCVAVSGGADSLALCLLAADWAKDTGRTLIALSVDHGLRLESASECQWVQDVLHTQGIEHHILHWDGEKPQNGIQAAAREARYGLLRAWCRANNVSDLLVAHHQDDQAETFLLRLARGSGVDGLCAMTAVSYYDDLRLLRPLLDIPKQRLSASLRARGQDWIEDPSNENEAFERVKIRQSMDGLAAIGLTPARLSQTAQAMQRAARPLKRLTTDWLLTHVKFYDEGYCLVARNGLQDDDEEILLRALRRIGMALSGESYPPRFDRLQRLSDCIMQGKGATLMGCRWIVREKDILVCREIRNLDVPQNLYRIDKRHSSTGVSLRILGQEGWTQVLQSEGWSRDVQLPKPVIYALFSFWDDGGVLAVPHLNYQRAGTNFQAQLTPLAKNRLFS